jgi:UDP-N-acetylmuramoyl-L-alanyl-D-glutamate--2,6-diaminopimelate ligase
MVAAGLTHVVIEATSHGLAQLRVTGCDFDIGVVTNITHEHLDYHGTYEAYRDAKAQLIISLAQTPIKSNDTERLAVLNQDDDSFSYLSNLVESPVNQISYGLETGATIRAENIISSVDGLSFVALGEGIRSQFTSKLKGEYNISNCLAAIATTTYGLNIDVDAVQAGIAALKYLPGRMEQLDLGQAFIAVVDFAHTPNALKRALLTAREILREYDINKTQGSSGRVIAIFGSAGLRDRAKRRIMADISADLADIIVLTAEDPRTESLEAILKEMSVGVEAKGGIEGQTYFKILDRGEAIRFGISIARPADLVIALGKGHEQSMCFGETEYTWDDRIAMRAALSEHLGLPGPEMPYLPTQGEDVSFT